MAGGIRRIAKAFYDRAGPREKKQAYEFFEKLGLDEDEKVSLEEFVAGDEVESGRSNEEIFMELDSDNDGFLDFEDVLVLFYYSVKKKITILRCDECRKLIFGPSYSCFECLFNPADDRYALCRACYDRSGSSHQHPLTSTETAGDLLHDQALLLEFSDLMSGHPGSLTEEDMKNMWEAAKSHIGEGSPEVEVMAKNYFNSMGFGNGPNRLDIKKFSTLTLTKQQEAFLTPGPNTHPATADILGTFRTVLTQSPTTSTAHNAASASTPHTHYVNPSTHRRNQKTSISPMKAATTVFKLLEMALTIAQISSMCTIM